MGERPDARSRYWEVTVPTSTESSEGLTNFLWELGALGVIEEEVDGRSRVRAFFPESASDATLGERVRAYVDGLVALGLSPSCEPEVSPLVDTGWADAWREHFRPRAIGRRVLVAPPWLADARDVDGRPSGERLTIVIEPGRAFGTGHHGSTAGCVAAVEDVVDADHPERALDIGTGSGILAIVAARLGVADVLAIDDDPDAVACAIANAALNGVGDRIRCVVGEASALDAAPAPLVVANLLTSAHVRLADRYRDLVAPQGALVLGGILDTEASTVSDAVMRAGFAPRCSRSVEGWTTLVLTRVGTLDAPLRDRR